MRERTEHRRETGRKATARYRDRHPDRILAYEKKTKDRRRARERVRNKREDVRQHRRALARRKYNNDQNYRIATCLRVRLRTVCKNGRDEKLEELIGCSVDELRDWLEAKFSFGMSWDNYGEWHIDHKKPCAVFDLTQSDQRKQCFHYSNLQPLWAWDNRSKGARIMVPSFYTTVIQPSGMFHSANPNRSIALLEPVTRDAVTKIIAAAAQRGITLQVLETYRSQELQELYYQRGVTQLQTVGVHHYGLACDLGIVVAGQVNWKADYSVLGQLAKQFNMVWGGDWGDPTRPHSFRDYDHIQRIAVADQPKLFDGSWYPAPDYVAPGVG